MPARFQVDDGDYGRLRDAVRQAGGELVRDAASERFDAALRTLPVPTLDVLPALRAASPGPDLFFQETVHLTPRGHEVVAAALDGFLEQTGLAPADALLIRKRYFTDDAGFLAWVRELNAELFRSPLYKVMMFVASTRMMTGGAPRRWKQFHLGTELEAIHGDGPFADLVFRFPIHLFTTLHVQLFAAAVEAAMEAAGATGCRTTSVVMPTAGSARARLEWKG